VVAASGEDTTAPASSSSRATPPETSETTLTYRDSDEDVDDDDNYFYGGVLSEQDDLATAEERNVAWLRATEIGSVLLDTVAAPLLKSLATNPLPKNWNEFWNRKRRRRRWRQGWVGGGGGSGSGGDSSEIMSNAECVAQALEQLGCTYVKFGQALASRPDIIPPPLAEALSKLQVTQLCILLVLLTAAPSKKATHPLTLLCFSGSDGSVRRSGGDGNYSQRLVRRRIA